MLSNRSRHNCAKCGAQAEEESLVTGSVPLNEALEDRGVDTGDTMLVMTYLRENISWRAVKYDQDMSITDAFGLMVGVSAQPASFLGSTTELPPWRRCELFPGATAGKIGEPSEQNREELNF